MSIINNLTETILNNNKEKDNIIKYLEEKNNNINKLLVEKTEIIVELKEENNNINKLLAEKTEIIVELKEYSKEIKELKIKNAELSEINAKLKKACFKQIKDEDLQQKISEYNSDGEVFDVYITGHMCKNSISKEQFGFDLKKIFDFSEDYKHLNIPTKNQILDFKDRQIATQKIIDYIIENNIDVYMIPVFVSYVRDKESDYITYKRCTIFFKPMIKSTYVKLLPSLVDIMKDFKPLEFTNKKNQKFKNFLFINTEKKIHSETSDYITNTFDIEKMDKLYRYIRCKTSTSSYLL